MVAAWKGKRGAPGPRGRSVPALSASSTRYASPPAQMVPE
jgi:hypothetical protein